SLVTPPPQRSALFPYTTLFRSVDPHQVLRGGGVHLLAERRHDGAAALERPGRAIGIHHHLAEQIDQHGADVARRRRRGRGGDGRSEEHTSELQSRENLVCRLLL